MDNTSLPNTNLESQVPVTNTVPPVVVTPPASVEPSSKNNSKHLLILLAFLVVLFLGVGVVILKTIVMPKLQEVAFESDFPKASSKNQVFVNCDDIRKVIEDGDKYYVACLGGVLVIDTKTGIVTNQISTHNGLGNSTATDLVKKGDKLYIGTQDGFTEFDFTTWKGKKISVNEGLVNGSNIELTLQGDTLWVGTFDGVSSYDTKTGKIVNFTKELHPTAEKSSTRGIYSNKNLVAVNTSANAYSSGGVAFFKNNKWTTFDATSFGSESRIEAFGPLVEVNNQIYFSDVSQSIWYIDGAMLDTWKKVEGLKEKLGDKAGEFTSIRLLGSYSDKLYILTSSTTQKILTFDPITKEIKTVHTFVNAGELNNPGYDFIPEIIGNNLWLKGSPAGGTENTLLTKFNLDKLAFTEKVNIDRPIAFYNVMLSINSKPLISAKIGNETKLVEYDKTLQKFKPLIKTVSNQMLQTGQLMEPIAKTSKIFSFNQECGQGCSKPAFTIYDYQSGTSKELELTQEVKDGLLGTGKTNDFGYFGVEVSWKDDAGKFAFSLFNDESKNFYVFDAVTESWTISKTLPTNGVKLSANNRLICNATYTFKENIFENSSKCTDPAMLNNSKFEIADGKLLKDGVQVELPKSDAKYSPFDNWDVKQFISVVVNDGESLWLLTNRGLVQYNPTTNQTELYTSSDTLLSNTVNSVLITEDNDLWSISEWGGLTKTILKNR